VETRYDAQRFRDGALAPRAAGVRRVVLLGDSFTEGQGVKEVDTSARRLEGLLRRGGARWQVFNAGRRGADFPGLADNLGTVLPYGADVVVYAMTLNDGAQSESFRAGQGYLNDWMMIHGRVTRDAADDISWRDSRLWAFVRDRWEAGRVSRESTRFYRDLYAAANAEGWRQTQFLIRSMDAHTRQAGGRFVVALWPWLVDLDRGYPFAETHETIRRFCAAAGIPFLDLRDSLKAQPAESLWVHAVDQHPNEIAHRLAAEALAESVRRVR
jgi:hypothetical protein